MKLGQLHLFIRLTFSELLEEVGFEYELYYTDISMAFFPAAEKRFEKYRKNLVFKKLNIEEDPISQGTGKISRFLLKFIPFPFSVFLYTPFW